MAAAEDALGEASAAALLHWPVDGVPASPSEAEDCLWRAARQRSGGVFQIEAAIQSAHCQRVWSRQSTWPAIVELYAAFVRHYPSVGARVGQAVAKAEAGDVRAGLALLDRLPESVVCAYQPYRVARAHLLAIDGQVVPARQATARAIGLTQDARVRTFLARQSGG